MNMWMSRQGSVDGPGGEKLFMYQTGNKIGLVVKTILRGYSALNLSVAAGTTGTALGIRGRTKLPYVPYINSEGMFTIRESREDGLSTERSRYDFLDAEDGDSAACHTWDRCGDAAWNRSAVVDNAL